MNEMLEALLLEEQNNWDLEVLKEATKQALWRAERGLDVSKIDLDAIKKEVRHDGSSSNHKS